MSCEPDLRHHRVQIDNAAMNVGRTSSAAAAELDAGPHEHHVPENAIAIGLAPDHLPTIEDASECKGCRAPEELGFEAVFHAPCDPLGVLRSQVRSRMRNAMHSWHRLSLDCIVGTPTIRFQTPIHA